MSQRNDLIKTTLVVMSAGLTGATVALLFAPQSGPRTRKKLKRLGDRLTKDFGEGFSDRVQSLVKDARALASWAAAKSSGIRSFEWSKLVRN